jgi:hypothetical protein
MPNQKGNQKFDEEDGAASSLQENLDKEKDGEEEADELLAEVAESMHLETIDADDENTDTIILTKA